MTDLVHTLFRFEFTAISHIIFACCQHKKSFIQIAIALEGGAIGHVRCMLNEIFNVNSRCYLIASKTTSTVEKLNPKGKNNNNMSKGIILKHFVPLQFSKKYFWIIYYNKCCDAPTHWLTLYTHTEIHPTTTHVRTYVCKLLAKFILIAVISFAIESALRQPFLFSGHLKRKVR